MPAGLQIFDASGNVIVDTNTRVSRVLGVVAISNDGAIQAPAVGGNYTLGAVFSGGSPTLAVAPPTVTVSGSTVSWTYNGAANRVSGHIIYFAY